MTNLDESRPTSAADAPAAPPPGTGDRATPRPGTTFETLAVCGFIFGLFAVLVAVFAVGLAARAVDEADDAGGSGAAAAPAADAGGTETLDVSLKEFAIDPAELSVAAGSTLDVTNDGAVVHNLAVDGVASDMLDPAESGELDLSELEPGTYTMICEVPGHEAAGMKGTITIE